MTIKEKKSNKRGFVLLLTLMVLIILATLIVQFQADTALHVRASGFRLEKIQCKYAAESGLMVASHLINDIMTTQRKRPTTKQPAEPEPEPKQEPTDGSVDPNSIIDPDGITDPNAMLEKLLDVAAEPLAFLLDRQTVEIGPATVEIEIQDENSKLPVLWALKSPYKSGKDKDKKLIQNLAELLDIPVSTMDFAESKAMEIAGKLDIPDAEITVRSIYRTRNRRRDKKTGKVVTAKKRPSSQKIWRASRKPFRQKELSELREQRRETMALFGKQWNKTLEQDRDGELLTEPLIDRAGSFSDYLGVWGHDKININTAPAEVLEAAFKTMGMTSEMAQAIVDYRQRKLFANTSELQKATKINTNMYRALRIIVTTRSDTFTIKIKAKYGRAKYELFAVKHKGSDKITVIR